MDGLRNPYLDKFVPPRRRQASESYRKYNPLRLQFVSHPITDLSVPSEAMLVDALDALEARLRAGAPPQPLPVNSRVLRRACVPVRPRSHFL